MSNRGKLFFFLLLSLLAIGCGEDDEQSPGTPFNDCVPLQFVSHMPGNYATYDLTYTGGRPVKVTNANAYFVVSTRTVTYDGDAIIKVTEAGEEHTVETTYHFAGGNLPVKSDVTLDGAFIWSFFFEYSGDKLTKVVYATPHLDTDWEWQLVITYNGNDDVTKLDYEFLTGPSAGSHAITTVASYDDHPNPYAKLPMWKFMMNRSWDNYDPEVLLVALSRHNPMDYTFATWTRAYTYTYNAEGFPTERVVTTTTAGGTSSFNEVFTYACD
ncbi:MAG TPA: hypothetical protein VD816_13960 [Ohtaekwangia sp.]|nr:hypothetical protein [Ohtaekwangia sp.]